MNEILSAVQMKSCDEKTITEHNIPSLVLMERAALKVVDVIEKHFSEAKSFYVVCGPGNNGGDGVAIARLLHLKGLKVHCLVLGNPDKFSNQLGQEIAIAESYSMDIAHQIDESAINQADLVIDAVFGIGLMRGLEGDFEYAAAYISQKANKVLAVDIPSGYDTDCGKLLGTVGVKADITVTFAYMKKGLVLGECKAAAGKVVVADVGIYLDKSDEACPTIIDKEILKHIKPRSILANKGSCGKLLIVAGSESIYGACYLSAKAALSTGTGLVKIFTHENNVSSIQQALPEAMYVAYDAYKGNELLKEIEWADTILVGPGIGTSDIVRQMLNDILEIATVPLVIDADGLNLIAKEDIKNSFKSAASRVPVIITPHLKEMERLTGIPLQKINYDMENIARGFAKEYGCIVVLKNHTTVVASENSVGYVTSGNEALATPGSGDVLAGVIASFVVQRVNPEINILVEAATFMHGYAGRKASEKYGTRGVLASQIIENLPLLEF